MKFDGEFEQENKPQTEDPVHTHDGLGWFCFLGVFAKLQ